MRTGHNPTTTSLKSKHFSRPPCRGCKTPCPVRATIMTAKRRRGTFVRRTKRTGSNFCLKNSEPVENHQAVAHGRSRPGTDVPGGGKVVEPVLHGSSNRVQPALKPRECKRGFSLNIQSIKSKFDALTAILSELHNNDIKFDVICLQETWLSTNQDSALFNIPGCQEINQGKSFSSHFGLIIFLSNDY